MSRDVDYIIAGCQEFARSHGLDFEYDHAVLYPGNVSVRFINLKNNNEIRTYRYNDIVHTPENFIKNITEELTALWFSEEKVSKSETKFTYPTYADMKDYIREVVEEVLAEKSETDMLYANDEPVEIDVKTPKHRESVKLNVTKVGDKSSGPIWHLYHHERPTESGIYLVWGNKLGYAIYTWSSRCGHWLGKSDLVTHWTELPRV